MFRPTDYIARLANAHVEGCCHRPVVPDWQWQSLTAYSPRSLVYEILVRTNRQTRTNTGSNVGQSPQ